MDSAPGAAYGYDYAHSRRIINKRSMKLRPAFIPPEYEQARRHFLHGKRRRNQSKQTATSVAAKLALNPFGFPPINAPLHTHTDTDGVDCGVPSYAECEASTYALAIRKQFGPDVQPPDILQQIKASPSPIVFAESNNGPQQPTRTGDD